MAGDSRRSVVTPVPVPVPVPVPTSEDLDTIAAGAGFRPAPGPGHWRLSDYVTGANYESFIHISDVAQPANFTHCGTCLKCGWQSMQTDEKQAHDIVVMHLRKHVGRLT